MAALVSNDAMLQPEVTDGLAENSWGCQQQAEWKRNCFQTSTSEIILNQNTEPWQGFGVDFHNLLSVDHSNILIQNHLHSVVKYICFLIPDLVHSMQINHCRKNKGAEALSQRWHSGGTAVSMMDNWWEFDPVLIKVCHQYSSAAELFASFHLSPMQVYVSTAWMWNTEWNQELSVIGDLWVLKKVLSTPLPSAKVQREDRDFLMLQVPSCKEGANGLMLKW